MPHLHLGDKIELGGGWWRVVRVNFCGATIEPLFREVVKCGDREIKRRPPRIIITSNPDIPESRIKRRHG